MWGVQTEHFRSYNLLWGALFAGSFPRASLLQKCHISSHALCSGWTHFYKPPSAAEGQAFLMYLLSYFLIFLLFLFSFYQYPPINHMFHGLLETPIHQLRTGVLWSLQHFSDLFKGLVLNSCTRDTFLLPVAIQMWAVHTSWRQQLPVCMLAAGRTGWCCIEKWFHYCQAQFGLSSHRTQQEQLQSCSRADFRAGLSMCLVPMGHRASTPESTLVCWMCSCLGSCHF